MIFIGKLNTVSLFFSRDETVVTHKGENLATDSKLM